MWQNSIFVVNEEPYCIWEVSIAERNMEFLDGIDTEYFDYSLNLHLEAEDEKRAAIALRTTLHHAIETMFSLLGSYIQAPDCAYAWVAKCSNRELRELTNKIGYSRNTLFTKLNIEKVTWESVAQCVFNCYKPGTERNHETVKLFSSLWQRLAYEHADQNHIDEYNSIKHGFRVRSGGFSLAVGREHEPGVAAPASEMKTIGHSDFGTSFINVKPSEGGKKNRSLCSKRTSINWSIEKVILLLQLTSMSITNITTALKIANGAEAGSCRFSRPEGNPDFEKPWHYTPGVTTCSMGIDPCPGSIIQKTKSELLKMLSEAEKS